MCYNGKCLHCISIETGSLIFAIFSIILTGLGSLVIIGALVYVNCMIAASTDSEDPEDVHLAIVASLTSNAVLGVALCFTLIPFIFTIVLIKGLVEKKAGLVKVYFIYIVVSMCLFLFGAVVGLISGSYPGEQAVPILLTISAFHGLILWMIYLTYKKIEVDAQYKQSRLVEDMH